MGAGVVFQEGPAPQNGHLHAPMAQVLTLFPHLHQQLSTPAPTTLPTCANNHGHLRRKSTRLVFSNSGAHGYAFYCIFAHFMCSSPFLKTWKSTPMRPGRPAEPLSVRLILKREGHIRRWMVEKRGDDAGRRRKDEKRQKEPPRTGAAPSCLDSGSGPKGRASQKPE